METLKPIEHRCVTISKDPATVDYTHRLGANQIGLILNGYDQEFLALAQKLNPDYLFCNTRRLPPGLQKLWSGSWRWALYEVTDPILALALGKIGADFIETMEIAEMLKHPLLKQ